MDTSSTSTGPANDHHQTTSITTLKALFRQVLRITVLDGRIFLGTFVGTDKLLNILLTNAEEFRIGPDENPTGRYVGQIMIPWRLVLKAEAQIPVSDRGNRDQSHTS